MKPLRFLGKVLCDESEYDRISLREIEALCTALVNENEEYYINDTGLQFIVVMRYDNYTHFIKAFPYADTFPYADNKDYARRCAEELLDKLNEDV